jgi:UDP-glucuronate decarboxylase
MNAPDSVIGQINLGNPVEFSILQLATIILELTGSRSRIDHRPLPQDDPRQRQPSITKAQDLLGWKPTTPLRDGLVKTIAYFESLLREPNIKELLCEDPPEKFRGEGPASAPSDLLA